MPSRVLSLARALSLERSGTLGAKRSRWRKDFVMFKGELHQIWSPKRGSVPAAVPEGAKAVGGTIESDDNDDDDGAAKKQLRDQIYVLKVYDTYVRSHLCAHTALTTCVTGMKHWTLSCGRMTKLATTGPRPSKRSISLRWASPRASFWST